MKGNGATTVGPDAPTDGAAGPGENARPASAALPADRALGQAVWLMLRSAELRRLFLADLEWLLLPPILLGQYRIVHERGLPVAFAAWASVSPALEARLEETEVRLAPGEWRSGDRLWLIAIVAPFGHGERALEECRTTALAGKTFKYRRELADGTRRVETMRG